MSLNRIMANMMAGSNAKIISGEISGNVNPYIEWIKWLSYLPEFQKARIQELNSKIVEELSLEELDEIRAYKSQIRMLDLFKIYGTSEISKEEYMEVSDFMVNQSIDELMLSKLSSGELRYAKDQIQYFSQIPSKELSKKVNEEQKADNYEKLSMADSYVLHIVSRVDFARSMARLYSEIEAQLRENDDMRQRSLYYAANPYTKR